MITLAPTEIALLVIVMGALVLLLSNRIRPDMVGLLVLLTLGLSHILSLDQVLAGFSRPAVITIVGLFVITAALERTGVVQWLADRLVRDGFRIRATYVKPGLPRLALALLQAPR